MTVAQCSIISDLGSSLGKSSPGILFVSQYAPVGAVVDAIVLVWSASDPSDLRDLAHYVPSLTYHVFPR